MSKILPILFNTEMVRAILDGRKTCTRRLVKPQPTAHYGTLCIKSPYQPGDILYIRETWSELSFGYVYKADGENIDHLGNRITWHPSIHMPKEASRIWLKVTDVRLERLQDITNDGCVAEGIYSSNCRRCKATFGCDTCIDEGYSEIDEFTEIWDSTIKKPDIDRYGWNANPWVWVIEFEQCEKLN